MAIGKGQIEAVDLTEAGLIRAGCLIQFPDADVTKRRFRRLAGMHLYGNDAAAGDLGVTLRIVNGQLAVEPESNSIAFAADSVIIPIISPERFNAVFRSRSGQKPIAAGLVAQATPRPLPKSAW